MPVITSPALWALLAVLLFPNPSPLKRTSEWADYLG